MVLATEVSADGKTASVWASIHDDFWRRLRAVPDWAKYFVLTQSTGATLCVPARLRAVCARPDRDGKLRATYEATVDCPTGIAFVRAALCPSEDGEEMLSVPVNFASTGESFEFAVTVYALADEEEGVTFCGGDNPLVRAILGCGKTGVPSLRWGTCTYPHRVGARGYAATTEMTSTWISDDMSCGLYSAAPAQGRECLMYWDDVPVLRALRPSSLQALTLSGNVVTYGMIYLTGEDVENVRSVTVDGSAILRAEIVRSANSLVDVTGDDGEFVGAEGELFGEPGEQYLAVATTQTVTVYEVDDELRKTLVGRVPRDGEKVFLCRGGAVALWSLDTLTVYEPNDDGEYACAVSASLPRGDMGVVVREGTRYHVAAKGEGWLARWKVTTSDTATLDALTVSDGCFLGQFGDMIAYGVAGNTMKYVTIDADYSSEHRRVTLLQGTTVTDVGNYFSLSDGASIGKKYIIDISRYIRRLVPETVRTSGRLVYDATSIWVFDFRNGLRKIPSHPPFEGVTSAAIAGRGVFFVANGKMYGWYYDGDPMLHVPASTANKPYLVAVTKRVYDADASFARLTVCMT